MKSIDYKAVSDFVKDMWPEETAAALSAGDDACAKRFVFNQRWDMERTEDYVTFKGDIDFLFQPGNDPEWIYAFNRLRHFISLGRAYQLTASAKYAEAFAEQISHWIASVRPGDEKSSKAWRTIDTGIRLDSFVKAYLLFRNTPEFKAIEAIFMKSVDEHASFILKNSWDSYHLMSNWGVLSNHGLYEAGVVFGRPDWEKEALRRLTLECKNEVYADGVQWEQSPMYHCEVLRDFMDVIYFSAFGVVPLSEEFRDRVRSMARANLAWVRPNGHEPMMGDSDDIDLRDLLSEAALLFEDGEMKAVGYDELDFETAWMAGAPAIEKYRALKEVPPSKTAFFLSESGNGFDRSDWSRGADYIRFHCGTLGAGHGHADQTHVSFVLGGRDYLVDSGRYTYVAGPDRYMLKNNYAHNVAVADGKSLYPEKDSWECYSLDRAVNVRMRCGKDYTAFEGGHIGYYRDGIFINRRVVWLKKAGILVFCDEFYAAGAHSYEVMFHFAEEIDPEKESVSWLSQSGVSVEVRPSYISRQYNKRAENKALCVKTSAEGFTSVISVFDLKKGALKCALEEVKSNFKGITFKPDQIEAVSMKDEARDLVLVIAHEEFATPTDTFRAAGCTGFGNVVLFDKKAGVTEIGERIFS